MTRSPKWSPRIAVLATTAALVFAACGSSTATTAPSVAPASEAPASEAPASASAEAFTPMVYPETGEAPCGQAAAPDATHDKYAGNFKKITAVDAKTVVFDLCNPDVAFLSKIAFSAFAINDTAWLQAKIDPTKTENQAIVDQVNGTGPYKLDAWNRGSDITMSRFDNYWGDKAKTDKLIVRWSSEAAQRLVELQSPHRRRHRQRRPDRLRPGQEQPGPPAQGAPGPEHLLRRLQQHVRAVRQREGPPGDRHGHRPAADRRQLLSARIGGRDPFHAVRHPERLRR